MGGPILWGQEACYKEPDACTEDQSYMYGTVHVQVVACTYALSHVRALVSSMKDQLYGNSTCTTSSCQKGYLHRESNQWPVQTCTTAV